jgi:hypothetical protein
MEVDKGETASFTAKSLKLTLFERDISIDHRCDDEKKTLSWGAILVSLRS